MKYQPLLSLSDVSGTMLITLYARARETLSKNPIIHDVKAVEIIEVFKKALINSANPIHQKIVRDSYNSKLAISMALRSRRFDWYVSDFLQRHPSGTVINLGCGLDTRFDRIDNGTVRWFDIDFPKVIQLRKEFMHETDRRCFIGASILEDDWTRQIQTKGPFMVLAEGVFMYLKEDEVKNLLAVLRARFGAVELVCEVTNRYWVERMNSKYLKFKFKYQLGMNEGAMFTFGIPDSSYFETWDASYHFLDEWTYFDDHEKKMGFVNLFSKFEQIRKVQWTIHYKLGD